MALWVSAVADLDVMLEEVEVDELLLEAGVLHMDLNNVL